MHFVRNALAHANKGQRQALLALINTIFAQDTPEAAFEYKIVGFANDVLYLREMDGDVKSSYKQLKRRISTDPGRHH